MARLEPIATQRFWGGVLVAASCLAFMALWWNRFIGMGPDGVALELATRITRGEIPYRDFYVVVPPLRFLKSALLISLFGDELIVLRAFGVFERCLTGVILYWWLLRLCRPHVAALSSVAAIVVLSGDIADTVAFAPAEVALYAVGAGAAVAAAIAHPDLKRSSWLCAGAGALAACTTLTKQTSGIGLTAAVGAFLAFVAIRESRPSPLIRLTGCFSIGWLAVVVGFTAWLIRNRAFNPFLDQVFVSGPTAKGPLISVLIRPVAESFSARGALCMMLGTAFGYVFWSLSKRASKRRALDATSTMSFLSATAILGISIGAGCVAAYWSDLSLSLPLIRLPRLSLTLTVLYGTAIVGLIMIVGIWRNPTDNAARQIGLFSAVSFSIGYMFSVSWTPYEPITFPGLALFFALAGPSKSSRVVQALIAYLLVTGTYYKLMSPYSWNNWKDGPVQNATEPVTMDGLKGFRLPPKMIDLIQDIVDAVQDNTSPKDPIFAFSYLPLVYHLTERRPATVTGYHWFDVSSDARAVKDAAVLELNPPKVIVHQKISEDEILQMEAEFRNGRRSGQRGMMTTLERLIADCNYALVWSATVPATRTLNVYVRGGDPCIGD